MNRQTLGMIISTYRKEKRMTQLELAGKIGVTDKAVSKWERDLSYPDIELLPKIAEIFNVSVDILMQIRTEENMRKKSNIGGAEVGELINADLESETAHNKNIDFWNTIGNEFLGTTALPKYGAFLSEEKLRLLGDLQDKKVLEIGCGTGRSLKYVHDKGALEIWGTDIAPIQIKRTDKFLKEQGVDAKLICAPMENQGEIPKEYFDLVYSVYAIGWTTDLHKTFSNIASYLKKNGTFIFSWSHPIHKCVSLEKGKLIFNNSYFDESWYSVALKDQEIMLSNRKLSTYINTLAVHGFAIEQLVEETDEDFICADGDSSFGKKARMLPVTFVIKARKI